MNISYFSDYTVIHKDSYFILLVLVRVLVLVFTTCIYFFQTDDKKISEKHLLRSPFRPRRGGCFGLSSYRAFWLLLFYASEEVSVVRKPKMPSAWAYISHASQLIGLALIFALFLCASFGAGIRSVDFFVKEGDAAAKLDTPKVFRILLGSYLAAETIAWKCRLNKRTVPGKANYVFFSCILPVHIGAWTIVEVAANVFDVDIQYTCMGILSLLACALAVRQLYAKYAPREYGRGLLENIYAVLGEFIVAAYILVVLPTYFNSASNMRMMIAVFVHPLVYHTINAFTRLANMRHETEPHVVVSRVISDVKFRSFMALVKRTMLLSVGGTEKTLLAVLVISIGDLFIRCFSTTIDRFILKQLGFCKNPSKGLAMTRKIVWMCEESVVSGVEYAALFSCPILHILLQPQKLTFDMGYINSTQAATSALFVMFLVQFFSESIAGLIAAWRQSTNGIPVLRFFSIISSYKPLCFWICRGFQSILLLLFCLVRYPTFITCSSTQPCHCLDISSIRQFYELPCAQFGHPLHNSTYQDDGLFEAVDSSVFIIAILTGGGTFAVLYFSVMMARNRRRGRVLATLISKEHSLKNEISEEIQKLVNAEMEKEQTKELWALLEPYSVPRDHVRLKIKVGEGAFGEVWLGRCRDQDVAVKRLLGDHVNKHTTRAFRNECNLMARMQKNGISHENLVQMVFCCWDRELLLLLEFCELGSLTDVLVCPTYHPSLTWHADESRDGGVLALMVHDVARGMQYMHSMDPMIIHRDLKTENVLIKGDSDSSPTEWVAKISDFGESRQLRGDDNLSMVGTPFFCCPEIVMCDEYNEKADVYSFGIMLYDIATFKDGGIMKSSWNGRRFSQVNVVKGYRPDIPDHIEPWLVDIMESCWRGRSEERPSFANIESMIQTHLQLEQYEISVNSSMRGKTGSRLSLSAGKTKINSYVMQGKLASLVAALEGDAFAKMASGTVEPQKGQESSPTLRNSEPRIKRGQSKRLIRALVLAKIVGYSSIISFVTISLTAAWSNTATLLTDHFVTDDNIIIRNFPIYNVALEHINIGLPTMFLYGIITTSNIAKSNTEYNPQSGRKYAIAPLILTLFLPLIFSYLLRIVFLSVDVKYYFVTAAALVPFVLVFVACDKYARIKWYQADTKLPSKKAKKHIPAAKPKPIQKPSRFEKYATLIFLALNTFFILAYALFILPVYFAASVSTRMVICLVVHPIAVESNEALSRIGVISTAKDKNIDAAKDIILNESQVAFIGKVFLSFCRRFMLLNLGDPSSTLITIIFTSMEEAFMRAFIIEMDTALRAWLGKPALEGQMLELQRFVWSVDINQSCLAEFIAIIVSTVVYGLMEPHALGINLGYAYGESVAGGLVFVQLLVELLMEGAVDIVALWAESEHGIPIDEYFKLTDSVFIFTLHAAGSALSVLVCLYSFVRYPTAVTCESNFICDCIHETVYFDWYNESCSLLHQNITLFSNDTYPDDIEDLDAIDTFSLFKTIIIFISIASLICLYLAFRKYKKRGSKIVKTRTNIERLDGAFTAEKQKYVERILAMDEFGTRDEVISILLKYQVPHEHIQMAERIGKGSQGEVWIGNCRGRKVAIKKVYAGGGDACLREIENFKRECFVMARLQKDGVAHPNIVQMLHCCWKSNLLLLLDYYPLGSLRDVLDAEVRMPGWYGEELRWIDSLSFQKGVLLKISLNICDGMSYIHNVGIIHKDLKPGNVIMCGKYNDLPSKWTARISDFGSAAYGTENSDTGGGSEFFAAPEFFRGERIGRAADVYSFSMTLLDMICSNNGTTLRGQLNDTFSHESVANGHRPTIPAVEPSGLTEIIKSSWASEPEARPTFEEIKTKLSSLV